MALKVIDKDKLKGKEAMMINEIQVCLSWLISSSKSELFCQAVLSSCLVRLLLRPSADYEEVGAQPLCQAV